MKLRATKIKLFNCIQSNHSAYPLPSKNATRILQKVGLVKSKGKICMLSLIEVWAVFVTFWKKKPSHFNASCLTFRRFVEAVERTNC